MLISDGAHNVDSVDSVLSAAYEAKSLDIPIYTVTLGKQVGAQNLSLAARSPRMIAFADYPLSLKIRVNIPVVTYHRSEAVRRLWSRELGCGVGLSWRLSSLTRKDLRDALAVACSVDHLATGFDAGPKHCDSI